MAAAIACPVLQSFIASVKTATVKTAAYIAKQDICTGPNITRGKCTVFWNVQARDVGYNISDENYGPNSRDLYLEQCKMHLHDDKEPIRTQIDEKI